MPNVTFATFIPSDWAPQTLVPQWAEICADMTLPAQQLYANPPSLDYWDTPLVMRKGMTHWSPKWVLDEPGGVEGFRSDPATSKKEYNDVPRIRDIFQLPYTCVATDGQGNCTAYSWWPNGYYNESQARQKGQSVSISARLWIGETMEGDDYVPEGHAMWKWFYEELKARYEAQKAADGVQYYLAHNYFTRYGHNKYDLNNGDFTAAQRQDLYSNPPSNTSVWPAGLYTPNANLSDTNLILQAIYMNGPVFVPDLIMNALFGMDISRMMGYYTGLFVFNRMEWLPGFASRFRLTAGEGAHPYQTVPAGVFERSDKAVNDPSLLLSMPFLAREFGNIYNSWGQKVKASPNPRAIYYYDVVHSGKDRWYPDHLNGGTEFYPGYISPGSENGRKSSSQEAYAIDLEHFGNKTWHDIAGPVAGGTVAFADFRLDGGTWITKTNNGSDVVAAWNEGRGFVRTRHLGNQLLLFYYNPYADNLQHTIEIVSPLDSNVIYTGTVCGSIVHPVRVTV